MLGKSRTPEMLLQKSCQKKLRAKLEIQKWLSCVCYVDAFVYGKSKEVIKNFVFYVCILEKPCL